MVKKDHHQSQASHLARVLRRRDTFIRTLKENLLWVRTFDTVEELRQALIEFRETYNATWLIERHGFIRDPADWTGLAGFPGLSRGW